MTHRSGSKVVITGTAPAECSDCGKKKELRPYGKGGAWICFPCGMKDEEETEKQFAKVISGERDI